MRQERNGVKGKVFLNDFAEVLQVMTNGGEVYRAVPKNNPTPGSHRCFFPAGTDVVFDVKQFERFGSRKS